MPGYVHIETATDHEPELVDIVEGVGSEAVVANEHFKKWGETIGAIGELGAEGDVGESGVVNLLAKVFSPLPQFVLVSRVNPNQRLKS